MIHRHLQKPRNQHSNRPTSRRRLKSSDDPVIASPEILRQVRQLQEEWDIPKPVAFQIARGQKDLSSYLNNNARKSQIRSLARQHDMEGSIAAMVIDGKVGLSKALFLKRWSEYRRRHQQKSVLRAYHDQQTPVWISTSGRLPFASTVVEETEYQITICKEPDGTTETIDKLAIQYIFEEKDRERVLDAVSLTPELAKKNVLPPQRILSRYLMPDHLLFELYESRQVVNLTLLNGIVLRGLIDWIGTYEIRIRLKNGAPVVVLRHAVHRLADKKSKELGRFRSHDSRSQA